MEVDGHARPPLVPREAWDRAPWNRWSFQHIREILPTVEVWRGRGPVRELPRDEQPLGGLAVTGFEGGTTLDGFLDESWTDGFLVLHHGAVVFERYLNGMDERTLHLSQSVAKSFVGALAGILAARGVVDVAAQVTDYLPELEATAFRGATLQQVLDMTSGVRFTENYTDPLSDIGRTDVAAGWKPIPSAVDPSRKWPESMFQAVLGLREQERAHGTQFAYRSIETDVLAFALERASGRQLAQLVSEEIWQPLGMEESANFTVDAAGFVLADGGLSACLRDYGRFGQAILAGGAGVIPAAWIEATRNANHALFGGSYHQVLPRGGYHNQFWVEDPDTRNLMARGVFGQLIYIDFARDMVAVKLSSWPEFTNAAWTVATLAAVRQIGEALSRGG